MHDAPTPGDTRPRVYARTRFVWVRLAPGDSGWIGYLWFGGSVPLKGTAPRPGPNCAKSWYEIEPLGWVCVDDVDATLNAADPVVARLQPLAPRLDSPWPHEYAESRGANRYAEIPTPREQRRREWDFAEHMAAVEQIRGGATLPVKVAATGRKDPIALLLDGVDLAPAGGEPIDLQGLPATVSEQRRRMNPLSTVAWSRAVHAQDRDWLLTADLRWVAKDRVAPYPKVRFKGVVLGQGVELPIAFFRGSARPKLKRDAAGGFAEAGESFARLSWVALTGQRVTAGGDVLLETREPGVWVRERDAVVPTPKATTPWGAAVGAPDTTGKAPKGRATWMEASIWQGWLVAFEGTRAVYATMISPGRGGSPEPGKDPLKTASTPVGEFKITGKFATATMVAPGEFIHSDVPWTQNFSGPHALHAAYWHDDWGNRMSAGCVNVSPEDGRWLFEFTEPRSPPGWHGVRWRPDAESATTFIVHR